MADDLKIDPLKVPIQKDTKKLLLTGNGGARPGAGRPKGSTTVAKKIQRQALSRYRTKVAQMTGRLLNVQAQLALGESNLYFTKTVGSGSKQHKVTEMITDPEIVMDYLNGTLDTSDGEYYYIATKTPDLRAITDMLDRTYGKATMHVEMDVTDEREGVMPVSEKVMQQFKDYMLNTSRDPNSILEAEVVDDYDMQKSNQEQVSEQPEI